MKRSTAGGESLVTAKPLEAEHSWQNGVNHCGALRSWRHMAWRHIASSGCEESRISKAGYANSGVAVLVGAKQSRLGRAWPRLVTPS